MNSHSHFNITPVALAQIELIQNNDYTLEGKVFRISIDGKGCDGFTYAMGFTESFEKDTVLNLLSPITKNKVIVHMDPFVSHFLKSGRLDYVFDPDTQEEGFIVINDNESDYVGKFFKDEQLVPKHLNS